VIRRSAQSAFGLAAVLCLLVTACRAQPQGQGTVQTVSILDQAAAEATAIVQRAEATALMLQAQAKATAVMAKAIAVEHTPTPAPTRVVLIGRKDRATATPTPTPKPGLEDEQLESQEPAVEVVRVGFSAEGGMIHIQFRAPPDVATKWWQGSVSVTDEATGTTFNEIPVMPRIGPLIGRPLREGQLGYVMLMHTPPALKPGSKVTVVLGKYEFKHVSVQ
jgi:hypothetical protein